MSDRLCTADGCDKPWSSRQLCNAHYKRWRKHGTTTPRFRGVVLDGKRICPRCKVDRPLAEWGAADRCKACNIANARRYYTPIERASRVCLACGREFLGSKRQSTTCSVECRRLHKAACDLEYHRANAESAAAARQRWVEANRDKVAEKESRRRARKRGSTLGPIDLDALWTGACGICGGDIDPSLRAPHSQSRSLDHVIPLVRGGSHTQDNLQWTHLRCNVRKGVRLVEAGVQID